MSGTEASSTTQGAADPFVNLRHRFVDGSSLEFDEQYRAAQLPLFAPAHPRVLATLPGRDYRNGSYSRARTSLIIDLASTVREHPLLREVDDRLRASSFRSKVAFDSLAQRMSSLHATIIGDVPYVPKLHREAVRSVTAEGGVLRPLLHGPFIGGFNVGRIYLPLEFDDPIDAGRITRWNGVFGRASPRLIAVGVWNLSDELSASEAGELAQLIAGWRSPPARLRLDRLSWTATHDDLTLRSRQLESITLTDRSPGIGSGNGSPTSNPR